MVAWALRLQALESREPTAVAVALELMLLALKVDPTVRCTLDIPSPSLPPVRSGAHG